MKPTLEIDLGASTEAWDDLLRKVEEISERALSQSASQDGANAETFWENDGVRIDPGAFFALFTGLE